MVSIYAIKNLINNKVYVGSTKSFKKRKYQHFYELKRNTHNNKHLQYSFNEYGKDKFTFFLLEECESQLRNEREIYWINHFNSQEQRFGYNIHEPNINNVNFKCSTETKQKMLDTRIKSGSAKPVNAYTTDLVFIASFNSVNECAKYFSMNDGIVFQILNGTNNRLSYKGKTFFYQNETPFKRVSSKQRNMSKFYKNSKN